MELTTQEYDAERPDRQAEQDEICRLQDRDVINSLDSRYQTLRRAVIGPDPEITRLGWQKCANGVLNQIMAMCDQNRELQDILCSEGGSLEDVDVFIMMMVQTKT